jgi:hypothetical protein
MSAAEKSIREELESALKEQEAPEAAVVETPVETAAPAVESEAQKQERERDEKGRFVSRQSSGANDTPLGAADNTAVPSKESSAKPGVSPDAPQPEASRTEGAQAQTQALAPPNGWTAEAKAVWHTLPKEVQEAAIKREQDVAKFTSTRDEHASFGKEIFQTVQPYLAQIQAEGGTPAAAIKSLLNTAYVLRTGSPDQKKQLLLQTARQFGVDLGTAQQGQVPPALETLQQRLDRLEHERSQERAAENQRLQTEVQTELEAFAADPKHPHFEAVKGHMSALIAQGHAKDLQDAYEQAVWARPDTRATLLAQQRAEEEQKRRADASKRAEEAKRKNVSITGGPGNTAQASAPGGRSIREELESAMAASGGAV